MNMKSLFTAFLVRSDVWIHNYNSQIAIKSLKRCCRLLWSEQIIHISQLLSQQPDGLLLQISAKLGVHVWGFYFGGFCSWTCVQVSVSVTGGWYSFSAGADSCLPALFQIENFQLYTKAKLFSERTFHRGLLGKIHGLWLSRSGRWW